MGKSTVQMLLLTGMLGVAACSGMTRTHGHVPREDELEQIAVGLDSKETVAEIAGRPSAMGLLDNGGWYYVQSRFQSRAWRATREIDRQVVAISFDDAGIVTNIERFGLKEGQVVALSRRVTDSNVKGIGFLRQLFGNFGNFAADQLIDN